MRRLLEVEGSRWAEREMDDEKGKIDTKWLAFVVIGRYGDHSWSLSKTMMMSINSLQLCTI